MQKLNLPFATFNIEGRSRICQDTEFKKCDRWSFTTSIPDIYAGKFKVTNETDSLFIIKAKLAQTDFMTCAVQKDSGQMKCYNFAPLKNKDITDKLTILYEGFATKKCLRLLHNYDFQSETDSYQVQNGILSFY